MGTAKKADKIDVDPEKLLKKYDEEREKRLRVTQADPGDEPDLTGKFADFDHDYYADPHLTRPPVQEEVDAVIIGGGMGGLMMAAQLRKLGLRNLRIVEKGGDFGGTWYWNRYPGAACDIESYLYLPLLEETGYMPRERYSKGEEIRAYLRDLATRLDLYPCTFFQTLVTEARWEDASRRWVAQTNRGDEITARFLFSCTGVLSNPKLPKIPGIESFAGCQFHTARWDHDYTKADLSGLAGKRVGVIGTGATAVQVIPSLAKSCGELFVFQRTPSSIDIRGNRPTDPEWFRALQPGWQRERQENFTNILSGRIEKVDLVQDGWTDIALAVAPPIGEVASPEAVQLAGLRKMEMARQRIENIVSDRATAEALKPYYHYFCKRPAFHDEYLASFNLPNVRLVDTQGQGVSRITPLGVVVDEREYPLDCIIYATGFDFLMEYSRESALDIYGEGGLSLNAHWAEGPRTLYGMLTDRFPNLFFLRLAQAGHAANYTQTASEQIGYIGYVVGQALAKGAATVAASTAAVDGWVNEVIEMAAPRQQFLATCTPGHYNYEGNPARQRFALLNELYGGGAVAYFELLRILCAERDVDGLRFGASPDSAFADPGPVSGTLH